MKQGLHLAFFLLLTWIAPRAQGDLVLVEDGKPRAEIVIAEQPQRSAKLAAQELQDYMEKISGAHLPIVTKPTPQATGVFVGRSEHTDRLKVTAEGLKEGAYRMVTGPNWLALLGEDTEFTPVEPWARNNAEIVNGKTQNEWNKITGAEWGVPGILIYKDRGTLPGTTGLPDAIRPLVKVAPLSVWCQDERGSFNAVCGLLMKLGVRWYAPGEIGEVLPMLKTITIPDMNETVRPDFAIRRFNVKFATHDPSMIKWAMRLGLRDPYPIQVAHGLEDMTNRENILKKHPEWFALYGGKRQNTPDTALHQLCYSNEELFQHTVRNVRLQFDHFKYDVVSVMPPDGFSAMCQCDLCKGKDTPERDQRGTLSDYVWDFVNRVAREVGKTHPGKKILNCAYGVYTLPPLKIEKLEPNVMVSIVGGRRPVSNKPGQMEEQRLLRESWLPKTSNPLINFENYPFTDRGWYLPAFTPHAMGESINALKERFMGEDIWLTVRQDFEKVGLGLNHFLVYFTQRMYWGGPQQDVDAMFREYVRLFYGPAEQEMLAFFGYSEANWQEMEKDKAKADHALALFGRAQARVDAASIHGRRLALIDDFLKGLRSKSEQLGKKRGPVPVLRLVGQAREKIVIDGKLDDEPWVKAFPSATCNFRELQTGRQPTFGTMVKSCWIGRNLYLAFRCGEAPGEKPMIGTTKDDDAALWYGDCIEVLLETDARSYYQIAVSPSGAVADLDRSAGRHAWFSWDSQAEVATRIENDHWIVEMRIPVTEDENDPLHQIIGHEPTRSLPWYINLCRQRIREDAQEHSAFSPTGADNFHVPLKFAHFYNGNSFQFDASEPDADYLTAIRIAGEEGRAQRFEEARASWLKAAESASTTPLQKSHALENAAAAARSARKYEVAAGITSSIPIDAVKKVAQMHLLLDQGKAPQVIEEYAKEDIAAWPFWKRGDGYFARGRARFITKDAQGAEADLSSALPWISEARTRSALLLALGQNRESNLQDGDRALTAYHTITDGIKVFGGADEFSALQGIARIQSKRGQHDEAIATLARADIPKLQGVWKGNMLLTLADVQLAAGRKVEAAAALKVVAEDVNMPPWNRKAAEAKLAGMK